MLEELRLLKVKRLAIIRSIKLYPQKNVDKLLILTLNCYCILKIFLHLLCNKTEMKSIFALFVFGIAIKFEINLKHSIVGCAFLLLSN